MVSKCPEREEPLVMVPPDFHSGPLLFGNRNIIFSYSFVLLTTPRKRLHKPGLSHNHKHKPWLSFISTNQCFCIGFGIYSFSLTNIEHKYLQLGWQGICVKKDWRSSTRIPTCKVAIRRSFISEPCHSTHEINTNIIYIFQYLCVAYNRSSETLYETTFLIFSGI